jgi:hypothetical protein
MADSRDDRKRGDEASPTSNPFKPMSLTPVQLHKEDARQIKSAEIRARETPAVSIGDHSAPAQPISERKFAFTPLSASKYDLKQEKSLEFRLRQITVTPAQMQRLRERRVAARDLGWVVPGHRIKIQS